jgi:hypothetical protein
MIQFIESASISRPEGHLNMQRSVGAAILAAIALAAALAGCSAGSLFERIPAAIDEPADTPARPAVAYQYPAVHDMPPQRPDQTLTDEQQVQMEKDLENVRDRQQGHKANSSAKSGKNAAQTAKDQPVEPNATGATGSKPNP